jgi:hypothetical protein
MYKKRTPQEVLNTAQIREHIGAVLKRHYYSLMFDELPPQLRAVIARMDEEQPELSSERRKRKDC